MVRKQGRCQIKHSVRFCESMCKQLSNIREKTNKRQESGLN